MLLEYYAGTVVYSAGVVPVYSVYHTYTGVVPVYSVYYTYTGVVPVLLVPVWKQRRRDGSSTLAQRHSNMPSAKLPFSVLIGSPWG